MTGRREKLKERGREVNEETGEGRWVGSEWAVGDSGGSSAPPAGRLDPV